MNYVGKIIYSVATPFHPFGGAVDIIVVQQQDGTFRSTPWYVRFGKFQGVLKGAEKIVRIEVNGVESDFHMYLDNAGEAYFIKEVASSKDSEGDGSLKESDSLEGTQEDTNIDERIPLGVDRLERSESDSERRFYEFQDEQSSLEGSVELSDYGSNRYENLGSVEHFVESQDSSSEVVLVSVDGHILTAPISSSERSTEKLQLGTPQFHLGPGEGTGYCEGNEEISAGEAAWAADYFSDLDSSSPKRASQHVCVNMDSDDQDLKQPLEGSVGDHKSIGRNDTFRREDIFKSCLELQSLDMQGGHSNQEDAGSPLEIHGNAEDLQEKSPHCHLASGKTEGDIDALRNSDGLPPPKSDMTSPELQVEVEANEKDALNEDHYVADSIPIHYVSNDQELEEPSSVALEAEGTQSTLQEFASGDECSTSKPMEPQSVSTEDIKNESSIKLEISLCGNLLYAGMSLSAAAEAFDAHRIPEEEFKLSAASIIKNESLVVRYRQKYLPWDRAAAVVLGMAAYGLELPIEPNDTIVVEQEETPKLNDEDSRTTSTASASKWRLWPNPFRRVKTLEHTSSNSSGEEVFVDSESVSQNQPAGPTPISNGGSDSPHRQLIRTNVPNTEQIASLNLKEGQNVVSFIFSTRVWGVQKVDAHIYLWKWNARIVISDVDGTITKSDVLGQFMPLVGKDWTQSGVARLFSAIKENGYQLLFLSARAIVQAYLTRSFLLNLKQDGKALPNGPVVISPDGLFPSLYREVIRRAPHEFKIACLEVNISGEIISVDKMNYAFRFSYQPLIKCYIMQDIKALFPSDYNPFYAGFGNRDTDELSYRKIGIPKGKIFIINPKGEVAISHRIDVKSYTSLHTLVNDMFPPTSMVGQEDYNSWNYWRMPLPDIDNL
ncbi:hypothetical protein RJ639_017802 [Escallonia herrerae]|uniref:phosphatidate phosphatase n=1 Tax=Escallonia herrerae TaxID=1293975 RepID=A0AA89ALC3_9ASTE|nr:hypothetical protein RJ639_017802 [Escallonia herrerae]